MTRPLVEYLTHIGAACDRVAQYVRDADETRFSETPMIQDAVVRQLEIIGEAGHQALMAYGDDPRLDRIRSALLAAYGMRNLVIHGYFGVDTGIVWETAARDLPALRANVDTLIGQL